MYRHAYLLKPSNNLARTATVSISGVSASAAYPLANIADNDVAHPFKAAATGAARIVFDCGSAVRVDGAFLPMHNIPAGTVVKWQGHTASSWATPDVDVTVTIPAYATLGSGMTPIPESVWANVIAAYPTAADRTKRYWSLSVASFASPLAIGELLFGPLSEFDTYLTTSNGRSQQHQSIVKQSPQGSQWAFRYPIRRRELTGTMYEQATEFALWMALDDEVGTDADPFIVVPNHSENVGLLVNLTGPIKGTEVAPEPVYGLDINLLEQNRGLPL